MTTLVELPNVDGQSGEQVRPTGVLAESPYWFQAGIIPLNEQGVVTLSPQQTSCNPCCGTPPSSSPRDVPVIANRDIRAISAGQLPPGGRGGTSAPENELDDRGSRPHKKQSITVGRDGEPPIQRDSKPQPTARPSGSRPGAFPVGNASVHSSGALGIDNCSSCRYHRWRCNSSSDDAP